MAQLTSVTDRPGLAEEQAALRRVATLVAQQPSPQEVFDAVTEAVGPLLGADLAFLHRFPGDGTSATIASWSATSEMLPIGTRLQLDGDSVAARIFRSGSVARIDGYEGVAGETAEVARGLRIRSTVGAPILVLGRLWGALIAATREVEPFPEDAERRIAAFTGLVATAIANAEARRELEEVAAEQRALRRAATLVAAGASPTEVFAAITTSAAEVFGVPFSSLIRIGPDERATMVAGCAACSSYVGTTWEIPPDDTGITRAVLDCQRPSRVEDHSRVHGPIGKAARTLGVGSVVGAPVFVGGSVWGVMVVGAAQDGPPLPVDAGDRLIGFTELVSTTIANSDTRERVDLLLNEQAALRRVAMLVAAEADADELFSAVSEEVAQLLGSGGAAVGRFEAEGPSVIPVGLSETLKSIPVGMRIDLDDSLACTSVYRTGRTARKDARGDDVYAAGAIGEMLQGLGLYSSVAAPIKVAGSLWGTLITLSTEVSLPLGTEERLEKFSELVATAIANAEGRSDLATAESEARGLADEQAALRRVATLVAQGVSPDELFAAVSTEVASLFSAEIATIGRFESTEPAELTAVGVSQGPNDFLIGVRTPLMEWLASTVVYRTGRTARKDVTADEITGEGTLPDAIRAMGFFSTVSAPIVVEGELWGVLTASSSKETLPSGTEKRIESFSELVATAIANAQGKSELAASEARALALANEQAALRRLATQVAGGVPPDRFFAAVAREVLGVLGVAGVIVTHYESDGMAVVFGDEFGSKLPGAEAFFGVGSRAPSDPGSLAAQVAETHSTARIDDFATLVGTVGELARQAGFGSGCAGPIMVNGELWGKICVFSEAGRVLPDDTEGRLHDFIELTATAIASYEARSELAASEARARELADEQAALRRVATLVAQGVSPGKLFSAVSEEVERLFRLDVGSTAAADVIKFEGEESVIVGASRGERAAPVGSRFGPADVYSSTLVLHTGRPARVSSRDLASGGGPDAEFLSRVRYLSQVASPILVEGRIWGVITMNAEEELPAGTEERLEKFTDLVATAIANAESRAELASSEARARELAEEQAALRRVATLVAQGAASERVFAAIAEEAAGIIDIPVVGVNRYEADGTIGLVGLAGKFKNFEVGDNLGPVGDETDGVAAMILNSGRSARFDAYRSTPGPNGEAGGDVKMSTVGVPIVVDGAIWGFMIAADRSGNPIPLGVEDRLARFTELAAAAVSNATTHTELLSSRARLVSAADETRRRLERDLHDGIQQWLVALALKARKAARSSTGDDRVTEELSALADDLVAVTDELREISRGIHPAILTDSGLDDALEALARRSGIRVDIDVRFDGRYDPSLEATVYYVVAEAITNAVKHAKASVVSIHGGRREGAIELEIRDDGVGGADPSSGSGLVGLKDRVDTLGGTISLASPAGGGTTVRVKLPAVLTDRERVPVPESGQTASAPATG